VEQGGDHVELERVAEDEGSGGVGARRGGPAGVHVVLAGPVLAQRRVHVGQGSRPDAPDGPGREPGIFPAQVARPAQSRLEIPQQHQRAPGRLAQPLGELLRRHGLQISRGQRAARRLELLDPPAHGLRRVVVGGLPASEALAPLPQEALQVREPVELVQQRGEVLPRGRVLETVIAQALQTLPEARGWLVSALEEVVQALRLVSVPALQGPLLAIEDLLQAPLRVVQGSVHPVALLEGANLVGQLPQQLVDAHHAEIEPRQREAVTPHPLERVGGLESLHQQVGQRVEGLRAVETEPGLGAVPGAVDERLHDRA
jgi:hypothetical protein